MVVIRLIEMFALLSRSFFVDVGATVGNEVEFFGTSKTVFRSSVTGGFRFRWYTQQSRWCLSFFLKDEKVDAKHSSVGSLFPDFLVSSSMFIYLQQLCISVLWWSTSALATTDTTEADKCASMFVDGRSLSSQFVHIPRTDDRQLQEVILYF